MTKSSRFRSCLSATLPALIFMNGWSEEIVVSRATRMFPSALPGRVVLVEKVFNTKTNRLSLRSDHESIRDGAGLFAMEQYEAGLARSRNGALHFDLAAKLKSSGDRDSFQIVVTLREPAAFLQHGDFRAIVAANKAELMRMAFDEDIGSLSLYEPPKTTVPLWSAAALFGQSSVDLRVLARSAYSHSQSALPSSLASGVRAATFESGLNAGFLSCLGVTPVVYEPMSVPFSKPSAGSTQPDDSVHSLVTFTNLVNAAPGASYYHRRSWTYTSATSRNFISTNQLATISMSTDAGEIVANGLENRAIDDWAYLYRLSRHSCG